MTNRNYSSNAVATTLSAPATDSQTSITVSSTSGFPAAPFTLGIDLGTATQELVLVTAVASLTLTVTRGYDSTSAIAHSTGATVIHSHAALDFRESRTHEAATAAVHGVTGSLVGTTDTQTLTGKTVSNASNTINGFSASQFLSSDGTGKATSSGKAVPAGVVLGTTDTQVLTNKDLSSATNTFPATLATDAEVAAGDSSVAATASSALSTHGALTAAHGATGAVMGTTNTQTVTNKDLSAASNTFPHFPIAESNTATVVVTSAVTDSIAVTFTVGRFASAPKVSCTVVGTSAWFATSLSVPTTAGFTIAVRRWDGVATSASVVVHWIAVQV